MKQNKTLIIVMCIITETHRKDIKKQAVSKQEGIVIYPFIQANPII